MPGTIAKRNAFLMVVAATLTFAGYPGATDAQAQGRAKVVAFSKAGNWRVNAVYSSNGNFNHCSASATYRSGTRVAFIAYASGLWRLQFYKRDWPKRPVTKFPARLEVDGRNVLRGKGFFRGRSAFIDLGRSSERVFALMRGNIMAIHSPSGTSSFRLSGTFNAASEVARCWKFKRRAGTGAFANNNSNSNQGAFGGGTGKNNRGAFGGNQGGAFGSSSSSVRRRAKVLSRGQTLDLATSYLSGINRPYKILPNGKNVLKHFPVNWKFGNGLLGGMKVYTNTRTPPQAVLNRLLAQQATNCKGRSATERETPLRLKSGRTVQRAKGICATPSGSILSMRYRVSKLKSSLLMVIMFVGAKKQYGGSSGSGKKQPGPNEL